MSRQMPWLPRWPGTLTSRSQTQIQAPSRPFIRYSMSSGSSPKSADTMRSRSSGWSISCQNAGCSIHRRAGRPVQASICGLMYVIRLAASQTYVTIGQRSMSARNIAGSGPIPPVSRQPAAAGSGAGAVTGR